MRKLLVLLTLTAAVLPNTGCGGRIRNLFRRGTPCCGTTTMAPAMISAPIAAPLVQQAPIMQQAPIVQAPPMMQPTYIQPAPVMQQMAVPHCQCPCPQVCPTYCCPPPCGCSCEGGGWESSSGYIEGGGECHSCGGGAVNTYDGDYTESQDGSSTYTDPGPTNEN